MEYAREPLRAISSRKASYELAIKLAEQSFAIGNMKAAEFLYYAHLGITDRGGKEVIEGDLKEFLKWKNTDDFLKAFAGKDASYMDKLVSEYGSITFEEGVLKGLFHDKRAAFVEKYQKN